MPISTSKVPKITSPCPLRFSAMPRTGADFCGKCERKVHNLDDMTTEQRQTFFASCSGEVCVAYTVRRATSVAAISLAAMSAIAGATAFAQEVTVNDPPSPYCDPRAAHTEEILMGGTTAGKDLQWIDESEAELPTVGDLPEIEAADWLPTPDDMA